MRLTTAQREHLERRMRDERERLLRDHNRGVGAGSVAVDVDHSVHECLRGLLWQVVPNALMTRCVRLRENILA